MEKAELLGKFQRLGKVLMTPVLILPVAGILVGLGNAFTSSSLLKIAPWLGLPAVSIFFSICKVAGPMDLQSLKRQLQHSVGFWVI